MAAFFSIVSLRGGFVRFEGADEDEGAVGAIAVKGESARRKAQHETVRNSVDAEGRERLRQPQRGAAVLLATPAMRVWWVRGYENNQNGDVGGNFWLAQLMDNKPIGRLQNPVPRPTTTFRHRLEEADAALPTGSLVAYSDTGSYVNHGAGAPKLVCQSIVPPESSGSIGQC
ncbi:hypothetical protein HPB52_022322 [Rhipicephalus sanguineus]|uniref:Uncharacterized protein n=1 Tax=Rhipicephalus sanguineus TaxID=34632 RepID=A0A9D4Q3G2_RHISA|nr:hypothetical protein HPB52_022322 [Rhipicephalus sanguineus]